MKKSAYGPSCDVEHTFSVVPHCEVERTVSLLVDYEQASLVLEQLDDGERLPKGTVLTGKVKRSASC